MPVGVELAQARRTSRLSLEELSAKTKIKIERLRAIEAMDWEELPTLVYLKGFLRAYAAEVQLDPDVTIERYLDELNEVAPGYAEREAHPPPVPVGEVPIRASYPDPDYDDFAEPELIDDARIKNFELVLPLHEVSPARRASSARYVPLVLVAVPALLVGWVIGSNLDTIVSRAKTLEFVQTFGAAFESAQDTLFDGAQGRRVGGAQGSAQGKPFDAAQGTREVAPAVGANTNPADATRAAATVVDPAPVAAAPVEAPAADAKPRDSSLTDLTGWWALTNRLDPASSGATNLNLGFHLLLQHRGNRVSGTGEKWMENGHSIPADRRTPIAVEGTLTGRRLELTFTERGTGQTSAGTFVMNLAEDGTLRGSFASDAANAQGTSLARRMEPPRR